MSKESLPQFFTLIEKQIGIALDNTKQYLLESRLQPLAKQGGHADVYSFIKQLIQSPVDSLHRQAFEALTTNETSFFRDNHVFNALKSTILPGLIESRRVDKTLRIWSCACSSGQEAISIAILIRESFPELYDWDIVINATDISESILEKARSGIYNAMEVRRGLDPIYTEKYFTKLENGNFQIEPSIKKMIHYSAHNLVGAWPSFSKFDLILLRNVLIYFNQEVKNNVLKKIKQQLRPIDGILILGAAESIYANDLYRLQSLEKITYYKANK